MDLFPNKRFRSFRVSFLKGVVKRYDSQLSASEMMMSIIKQRFRQVGAPLDYQVSHWRERK
jgi:hypothetical protein